MEDLKPKIDMIKRLHFKFELSWAILMFIVGLTVGCIITSYYFEHRMGKTIIMQRFESNGEVYDLTRNPLLSTPKITKEVKEQPVAPVNK